MSKYLVPLLLVLVLLASLLAGCGATPVPTAASTSPPTAEPTQAPQPTAEPTTAAAPGGASLKITGAPQEMTWTEADLQAMETMDVEYTNNKGETTTYTGVLLSSLLQLAGVQGSDGSLVLVADDGYTAEVPLADVQACANCLVAFDPAGGLRTVLPDFASGTQVKGLIEIQVTAAAVAEQPTSVPAGNVALKITGKVANEVGWTEEEVRAMETMDVESTNKQGEASTYTGVSIAKLLEMAGPAADATTLVFVADDGYTAEAPLADVLACEDCIVSFRDQGGFSTVLPEFAGALQVKGVVEIQVK
jgi:hypothetical protein